MSAALRLPLGPAAALALLVALSTRVTPALAVPVALVFGLGSAALALASADRLRRLIWLAAAATACTALARLALPAGVLSFSFDPLADLRGVLAMPLRRLVPDPESAILLGIVLGERAEIPGDLKVAFARSGTTHLLAISGFNMTLVAGSVALVLRGRVRPAIAAVLVTVAVAAYCLLVGLAPSVARAGIMAAVAALGFALGRRAAALNALCAAVAVMLVLEPDAVADAGLQLSVAATAGLLSLQAPIAARLGTLPPALRHGLATTLAASIPTIPLVIGAFGRLSLVSPLANLLAVPLFPPLMVAGVAASVVGALSLDAGRPLALAAYALALALRRIVETSAAVPGAALDLPSGPGSAVATAAVVAAIAVVAPRARFIRPRVSRPRWWPPAPPRRRVAIVAGAFVVIAGLGVGLALPRGPALRVRALDVGQGDAFLIESDGRYALIDGGPDPGRLVAELGATLPPWARRIDVVALTHAHVDHGAGLLALFDRFEIGLALEPRGLNDVPLSTLWHQAADRAGVAHREVAAGARVRFGAAALRILAPNDDPKVDVPSLVVRLERGGFAMLFMGDATEQAQADLLLDPANLGATVYVPPHHGAATPNGPSLVRAVHPDAAVLSVGANNRYGHPTPETLAALGSIPTYRTDRDGTVELNVDGAHFSVRVHANDLPAPRGRPVPLPAAPR